jgi:hypothetical protein
MSRSQPVNLAERAMLVKLAIGKWSPSIDEEEGSAIVEKSIAETEGANTTGTPREVGTFKKWLINTKHPLWQAIVQCEGRARKIHKFLTLKWVCEGAGVLPVCNVSRYPLAIAPVMADYWAAVDEFIAALPELKAERKAKIGHLYSDDDYPTDAGIREDFRFAIKIVPLPSDKLAEGLMGQLSAEQKGEVETYLDGGVRAQHEMMQQDLLERIKQTVGRMAQRLSNPTATFRDSLVGNVRTLSGLLRDLNVMGSDEIEEMQSQIDQALTIADPQALRDNPELRAQVALAATEISNRAGRKLRTLADVQKPAVDSTAETTVENTPAPDGPVSLSQFVAETNPGEGTASLFNPAPEASRIM